MNKKRLICIVLASTMMLTLLSGCSKAVKPAAVVPNAPLKPVELTMYWIGGGDPKDADAANADVSKYLKTKINATVKVIGFDWGSYDTKVGTMIAAGEPADLIFTTSWAMSFNSNAQKGAFLPLEDLLSKYGQNAKKALGTSYLKGGQVGGVQYGIPVNKDSAHDDGFMFNKKMVDKYKFDITKVKTLEDLEPMLKVIKDKEQGNIVTNLSIGAGVGNGPTDLLPFDGLSGDASVTIGEMTNSDQGNDSGKIVDLFDSQEMKDQLTTVRKFYQEGYVRKDAPTLKNDTAGPEGKQFVSFPQMKPGGDVESSTPKMQLVQQEITKPISTNSDINNSMWAISKTSKNPERSMMLLDLLYSDKTLLNKMFLGVEGTNYTKVSADTYKLTDTPYKGLQAWMVGNQFLDYLKTTENPAKWTTLKAFNKAALPLDSLGFTFDSSNVTTQMAALVNASKQYVPVIVTGAEDPTKGLAQYKAARKAAGEDAVIAEMQKQYDAFIAAKKK